LGRALIGNFPDSEISCKIDEDVRGRDVFIIQPTCPPVNDNLMELLIMIDSFMRASADRITAVIPYFGYARQDRKDEGRVPITAKLVANLIMRAGANRVLTMDLHAAQIQGFFDIPTDHLYAAPVIDDYIKTMNLDEEDLVVVSPDEGSIKRALAHMTRLGGHLAIIDKRRSSAENTRQAHVIGSEIEGKTALIFDDMISTGSSICGAAQVMRDAGARQVYLAATHGLLVGGAIERLQNAPIDQLLITDTIPLSSDKVIPKIKVLSVAPLLGEAIKRIHSNESVSRLFV
jgi:ribose-phosphate pyrophosphokinase